MREQAMRVDLNCDLGEGCTSDADLMGLITSANVCCGIHAGDPLTADRTLVLAAQHGVRVGAHPGYADREHMGRREMTLPAEQVRAEIIYQVSALQGLACARGLTIAYVKLHGALYNQANREPSLAALVASTAKVLGLPVMGLPDSALETACLGMVGYIREGFADRRYRPDGSLVPRTEPDAFVTSPAEAVSQAFWLIRERGVESLCVHGDNPEALSFVRGLRDALTAAGVELGT
jgi:UPF0271 protein